MFTSKAIQMRCTIKPFYIEKYKEKYYKSLKTIVSDMSPEDT